MSFPIQEHSISPINLCLFHFPIVSVVFHIEASLWLASSCEMAYGWNEPSGRVGVPVQPEDLDCPHKDVLAPELWAPRLPAKVSRDPVSTALQQWPLGCTLCLSASLFPPFLQYCFLGSLPPLTTCRICAWALHWEKCRSVSFQVRGLWGSVFTGGLHPSYRSILNLRIASQTLRYHFLI